MTAAALAELVSRTSFAYRDEDQLQAGLAALFTDAGHACEREVRLSRADRLDLLVERVCVEVKVAGTVDRLATQLARYAASDRVAEFLVVTNRARHGALPAEVGGKPITVVRLGGAG